MRTNLFVQTLKVSANRINLNRTAIRVALIGLFITLGIGNAWAGGGSTTYYANLTISKTGETGKGKVYYATNNTKPGSETSGALKSAGSTTQNANQTYYWWVDVDPGYNVTLSGKITAGPATAATLSGSVACAQSSSSGSGTSYTATANIVAVTVNSVNNTSITLNPTNPSTDYPFTVTFGTSNLKTIAIDLDKSPETTDGKFTITNWSLDGTNVVANGKFNGGDSYGGASRNNSTTVSLQSKASGSTAKTCTVTANFPALAFVDADVMDVYTTQNDATKTGSADFNFNYGAEDDFPTTPSFTHTSGDGAFTVTGYEVTPDFSKGTCKVTVNYSFNPNGVAGTTKEELKITSAGGLVATATVTGESEAEATDDAKVIAADGETLIYQGDWATAWSKANLAANAGCTISMLRDVNVAGNQTVTNTFTFDLNGKTMHGVYNGSIIYVNTAGKTITIKDSKTGGKIENISERNGVVYLANIEKGNLVLESGTLYAKNTAVFNHSTLASLGTRAVNMSANTTFTMNGGTIEAVGGRNVYGIYQASSSANNTADKSVVTIKGGTIKAEAPAVVYGILSYGKVNMSAGTIDVTVNTETTNSNASYVAANFNDNTLHRYAYGIRMYATSSATLANNYFGTLTITGGTINVTNLNKTMNGTTLYNEHIYGVKMENSVTGAGAGKTAPDGTKVMKACAIGSIENATITLTHTGVLGYGVMANGCYNSVDNQTTPFQIKNSTINVTTFQTAYGIYADAYVNWSSTLTNLTGNGGCTYGNFELTNTTINATTTGGSGAYCGRALCTSGTVAKAKETTGSTSTGNATYYGEYSAAGKIVVNSGTYTASAATSSAYGFMTDVRAKCVRNVNGVFSGRDASTDPKGSLSDNTPTSEAYPELYIHGGEISATTGTSTTAIAVQSGGNTVIDGGTFNAYSGAGTAYGLYVPAGKTVANGVTFPASATTKAYGVYVTGGISDWSLFTYYGEVELNNCNASGTARSATDARGVFVEGNTKVYTQASFDAMKSANNSNYTTYGDYAQVGERAFVGKATINGGTYTATAETNTAYGIVVTSTRVSTNKEAIAYSPLTVKNATITAKTNTGTTAYGVQPGGGGLIENCTITATAGTTTASGVRAIDKTTVIKNSTITAKGTDAVYGLEGYVDVSTAHGNCWHGDFDLTEAGSTKVTAESTGSTKAYTIYLNAKAANVASGTFAGDYATAANATINGGTYIAKTNGGTSGYTLALTATQTKGSASAQPEVLIEGGKFNGATAEVGTAGVVGHVQLKGGYYVHNTNLSKYIPEGYEEVPLASDRPEYTEGYRYEVDEEGFHGIDVCKIGSTKYKSLEEALQVVTSGQTIIMTANYVMATPGDYVLPSGAKLLVPYSGQTATKETSLEVVEGTSAATLNLKLTFGEGVHLVSQGVIECGAKQTGQGSSELTGQVYGSYGHIYLREGSSITVESGASLYAWGYVTGKGEIILKNGGKSYEMFQFGWYKGGNTTSDINSNKSNYKIFPMTDYSYQNIECPITYYPGSSAYGRVAVKPSSYNAMQTPSAMLVGTADNSMFKMTTAEASANTWVKKVYDPETDITNWIMNSGASISGISMNVGVNVNSADFYLPITSNFRITLNYGEMNINNDVIFLPGSQLIINKEATGILKSGKLLFFYDAEDWFTGLGHVSVQASGWSKAKTCGYYYYPATYSPTWGTTNPRKSVYARDKASLDKGVTPLPDAELFVHGKMIVNGSLYTSGDGNASSVGRNANIHSTNEDAGKIQFNTKVTGSKALYKVCFAIGASEANNSWSDMIYGGQTTAYPAHLTNGDGTYVQSSGTEAGKQYVYVDNQWQCWEENGCYTYDAQNHPYAKPAAYVQLTSDQPDANHLLDDAATGTRNFVWDADCYWWEVVTTPTAEGYYQSINPDYNGKYNYYYYDGSAACWKIKKITVTWNINGSTTDYSVGYGTKPEWLGATPSKSSSSSNYVWRWDGWTKGSDATVLANDDLPYVTENTTFTAHFYEKYYEYNITFKNSDGTILDSRNWRAGTTPSYEGTPTKNPTVDYTYEFNGSWSPAITTVSGSATYTAQYTQTPRAYTITFFNYDMSKLGTAEVVYNNTPSNATYLAAVAPKTEDPYKPDNSAFSFEFAGWRLQGADENGFAQVKGDQSYIAQFNQTTKKYKISFVDDDGETVLHYLQLEYGQTPSYTWADPDDKQDVEWNYSFDHWDPSEFAVVEGAQTYTAVYNKTKREYDITWKDGNGATLKTDQVAYGETPAYSGSTPQKASTDAHSYVFNNTWSPAIVPVTGPATYTAQFDETERKYRVTWDAATNGGTCVTEYTDFSYNAAIGTLPVASKEGHTFNGWFTSASGGTQITAATKVTADVTYHAQFTINTYSFSIGVNPAGYGSVDVSSVTSIPYNSAVTQNGNKFIVNGTTVTATPTAADAQYTYAFDHWNNVPNTVTGNVTDIKAVFTRTTNTYTVTWKNEDGTTLETDENVAYGTTPTYNGATPTKAADEDYTYTFNSWTPSVGAITGNTEYTATYSTTPTVASVTANEITTYYKTLPEAFTAANSKSECTIRLLNSVSGISASGCQLTYTRANGICTLDLNNCTVSGSVQNASNPKMMQINATGATFTITDNSQDKGGKFQMTKSSARGTYYAIQVSAGTLVVNNVYIYSDNQTTLNGTGYTYGSNAIQLEAGTSLQVNGGKIESKALANARAINALGSSSVTITNGTFIATTTYNGSSDLSDLAATVYTDGGTTTINNGTFTATTAKSASHNIYATSASQTINVSGGKFEVSGGTTTQNINNATAASNMSLTGGYYSHNANLATYANTPYHVLPLTGEDPYKYEVAEAYTVTFIANGHGIAPDAQLIKKDENATEPTAPSETGWTFGGWYKEAGCSNAWDFNTDVVMDVTTLYAKWTSADTGFWLDIVDVNNSENKLLLNVSGWPSDGWPYNINGTSYSRDDDRLADRTMWIPYSGKPGEDFIVTVRKTIAEGVIVSKHTYIIPQEVTTETTVEVNQTKNLYIKGTTLTVSQNMTAHNIYVAPDAKLQINIGKTLNADTIFLRTTPTQAAELDMSGATINAKVYYTRIISDKSGYFQFGLPLSCDVKLEDIRLSDGANPKYYTSSSGWILRSYDEKSRAESGLGNNWKTLGITDTISGGVGYEMYSGMNYRREFYFPVDLSKLSTSVPVSYTKGENPLNNGWNMLVSPLTNTYNLTPAPENMVVSWMESDGFTEQGQVTEIAPVKTFAYQASEGQTSLSFASNAVPAPRRVAAIDESTRIQWIHLDVKDMDGIGDQTSIYSHPTRYEQTYKTGIDVAKQSLTASRAILYSTHAYGDMAFAGVSDSLLQRGVALTVYSPSEQALTISMRENDWLNRMAAVWLIDHETGMTTDLLWSDYTFDAVTGTMKGRFTIMGAFFAPGVTTELDNVQGDNIQGTKARKVIIDQKMYIQINGRWYDANGKLLKTEH